MAARKVFAGAKLRALRAQHQLTQSELAARLDISTSYVNQLESNQRPLTAAVMLALADWAQRIVTLRPDAAGLVALDWPYKVHLVLGMTIFLLFPFSRLVHVWSGFGTLAYVFRPYQVVRSRKLGLTPNDPRQP